MTPDARRQHLILDQGQIEQKIIRMAYQMYEQNFEEQELVLAGIHPNGYALAHMLAEKLRAISPLQVQLLGISVDKEAPFRQTVEPEPGQAALDNKAVVVVDDVLNTGKTLAYTLNTLLQQNPKKIEIATLVNRHHPRYPVAATYTGYSLATTLREHVAVVLEGEMAAYLH